MSTGNAGVPGLVIPDLEGEEEIGEDIDDDCFIFFNIEIFILYNFYTIIIYY